VVLLCLLAPDVVSIQTLMPTAATGQFVVERDRYVDG